MSVQRVFPRGTAVALLATLSAGLLAGLSCPGQPGSGTSLVALAGPDLSVTVGGSVVLQGSATGGTGTYTYLWTPTTGLNNPSLARPTFTATTVGQFSFTLTVADTGGATAIDAVVVTVNPTGGGGGGATPGGPLTANAGIDRVTALGVAVVLTGSVTGGDGNYDIAWTPTTGLQNSNTLTPTFTPSQAGTFELTLTVTDGTGASSSDKVLVTVSATTVLNTLTWGPNFGGGGYQVVARFTGPLDPTSAVQLTSYRITGSRENPVSAGLSTDGQTVTLVFTAKPLTPAAAFDISVGGAIRDAAGGNVPQISNRVPAANTEDTTRPTVSSRIWGVDFAGSYQVLVKFSEAMDLTTTQNAGAYRMNDGTRRALAKSATLGSDGQTVTLLFEDIALSSSGARIDVGLADLKDINGNALSLDAEKPLTANPLDVAFPLIVADSIRHEPNYAGGGSAVRLRFTEAMDRSSAETLAAYRVNGTTTNPISATLSNDGRTVRLVFQLPLAQTDTLDVSVGDAIKDINGKALPLLAAQTIAGTPADVTPPTAPTLIWLDGTRVSGEPTGYALRAVFNEAMDRASVETAANWRITGTTTAPTLVTLSPDNLVATLSFDVAMTRSDRIDVSVNNSIKDLNGNAITTISLPIGPNPNDITGPTLAPSGAPTWGAGGSDYTITLTFSEVMDKGSAGNIENYVIVRTSTPPVEVDHPTQAVVDPLGKLVTLTFANTVGGFRRAGAAEEDKLQLSAAIRDVNGRGTSQTALQTINGNAETTPPAVATGGIKWGINKAPYQVNVTFTEVMDLASAADPANYGLGIGNAPPTSVTLSPDGKTAILSFESGTYTPASQLDVLNGVRDINGRAMAASLINQAILQDVTADTSKPALVSQVWSKDNLQYRALLTFTEALDATDAGTPANYTVGISSPATATLQDGGNTVMLVFTGGTFARNDLVIVTGVKDMHGNEVLGTSGIMQSNPLDTKALSLVAPTAKWAEDYPGPGYQLELTFANEVMDLLSAETVTNYQINGAFVIPSLAQLSITNGRTVTLTFSTLVLTRSLSRLDAIDFSLGGGVLDINGRSFDQVAAQPVTPSETNKPSVLDASEAGTNEVVVIFDEVMDRSSAETIGNYSFGGSPTVLLATLATDGVTVLLSLDSDPTGQTLTVSNVRDINSNVNNAYTSPVFP